MEIETYLLSKNKKQHRGAKNKNKFDNLPDYMTSKEKKKSSEVKVDHEM